MKIHTLALVAVVFSFGVVAGLHFGTPASASTTPKLEAFSAVIGGKLDVFAPGVAYKTISTENNADFSATQITRIKRHIHAHSAEFLYVVSGRGTVIFGKTNKAIGPGDMISIPMGTPHAFTASGAPLRFVEVDVPSIAENDTHYLK